MSSQIPILEALCTPDCQIPHTLQDIMVQLAKERKANSILQIGVDRTVEENIGRALVTTTHILPHVAKITMLDYAQRVTPHSKRAKELFDRGPYVLNLQETDFQDLEEVLNAVAYDFVLGNDPFIDFAGGKVVHSYLSNEELEPEIKALCQNIMLAAEACVAYKLAKTTPRMLWVSKNQMVHATLRGCNSVDCYAATGTLEWDNDEPIHYTFLTNKDKIEYDYDGNDDGDSLVNV